MKEILNESDKTISVTFDSVYGTLPKPTMRGYTFTGWLYSETNEIVTSTTTVNITENITLVARWEIINYTATFVFDDGTQTYSIFNYGEEIDIPENGPSKPFYKFK